MKRILIIFIFLIFCGSSVADESVAPIGNDKLRKIFAGKTAIGKHLSKRLEIKDYYSKKGKFISLRSNGDRLVGKWWISKKRDGICVKYKHKPDKMYCRTIVSDGKGGYKKIRGRDGKVLVHYEKIVNANKKKI